MGKAAGNNVDDDLVLIGIITKPHGICGELKVKPLTDFPTRFQNLKQVFMVSRDGNSNEYVIQNVKIRKDDTIIIKFDDINSISQAEQFLGLEIAVRNEDCVKLPPNFYYLFDLVGKQVVLSHGKVIGTIQDIETNSAQDILIVRTVHGRNVMVPFVKELVPDVLLDEGKVVVKKIPGLFDEGSL